MNWNVEMIMSTNKTQIEQLATSVDTSQVHPVNQVPDIDGTTTDETHTRSSTGKNKMCGVLTVTATTMIQ